MNIIDADGHIVERDADIRKYPYQSRILSGRVDCCLRTAWTQDWAAWSAFP